MVWSSDDSSLLLTHTFQRYGELYRVALDGSPKGSRLEVFFVDIEDDMPAPSVLLTEALPANLEPGSSRSPVRRPACGSPHHGDGDGGVTEVPCPTR